MIPQSATYINPNEQLQLQRLVRLLYASVA